MDHEVKEKILNDLSQKLFDTKVYHEFFNNVQQFACNSFNMSLINMGDYLIDQIIDSDMSKNLSNIVLNYEEVMNSQVNVSSNSYLSKAQTSWERKLIKNLNSICTDFSLPLSKKRNPTEGQELRRLWNELGTNVPELKKFRPIYTIKDFLEHILSIKCANLTDLASQSISGLISIPIKIKTLHELKNQYRNLSIEYFQSGLDDTLNSVIEQERFKIGQKVCDINDSILSKEFSKQGCSRGLRAKLWSQILNVNISKLDIIYYNYLKQCVFDYDLLMDSLYYKVLDDVKSVPVNDDQVFVFEDLLYQVLLVFSRDTHVLKCFEKSSIQIPKAFIKSKSTADQYNQVNYPPNGVLPFESFSMLVAPICYVYNDPILLYFIFRKLFMKYFFKLTIISCDPQSIIGLCALFENILQCKDPTLFYHLRKIEVQPLQIVFKWIVKCFSGYLASSQLLELWDRMLAFNSLEILPIFAAGVFIFRRENLILATNKANIESILDDLTTIKVVSILQLVLL